jgi:hypothetical protein
VIDGRDLFDLPEIRQCTDQRTRVRMLARFSRGILQRTADDAAATYSALSNPSAYALLTAERGWNPDKFGQWLSNSLTLLLLRS